MDTFSLVDIRKRIVFRLVQQQEINIMVFEIYISKSLESCDYIVIVQSARTVSDGCDRKEIQNQSITLSEHY
jgi:hypothetical protein